MFTHHGPGDNDHDESWDDYSYGDSDGSYED